MTQNKETIMKCLTCGAKFLEGELVMGKTESEHTISDWICPYCGSLDYIEVII